jgi:monovalent cation:H+ antiporter-2, CPA2 family
MESLDVLVTFAAALGGALVLGYAARLLKLSPIVGYLVAGILVGPFTPGFVADHKVAEQFAEIGIILLLFGIGLRFHLRELFAVWRVAVPGALIQSTVSTVVVATLLHLAGFTWTSGIILGLAISVASTVVMSLVLGDHGDLHAPTGHISIGWTVVEDLLTVAMLLLLPIVFPTGRGGDGNVPLGLGVAVLKIAGLIILVYVLGRWVIPWVLTRVARTRARELFTLCVLAIAIGIAVGSAKLFGVSVALGAFLAGLAVGRSEFAAQAAGDAVPMRDAFAVLFFVSVGMLFDPRSIVEEPLAIVMVLFVVILVKPVAAAGIVKLLGRPLSTAVRVGAAFSQVGEFSFILGAVAVDLGLLGDNGLNAVVAASVISIAVNPSLYRWVRRFRGFRRRAAVDEAPERPGVDTGRCVLVGYGPVGRIAHELLTDSGVTVTVVDLNVDTVRQLKAEGVAAVYGDALRAGVLEEAGIESAGSLVVSTDLMDAAELVRQARRLNPDLRVLARCAQLRDADDLRRAGADVVAAGEAEVAVALAEAVSPVDAADLGAVAGQREAIRRRLYKE